MASWPPGPFLSSSCSARAFVAFPSAPPASSTAAAWRAGLKNSSTGSSMSLRMASSLSTMIGPWGLRTSMECCFDRSCLLSATLPSNSDSSVRDPADRSSSSEASDFLSSVVSRAAWAWDMYWLSVRLAFVPVPRFAPTSLLRGVRVWSCRYAASFKRWSRARMPSLSCKLGAWVCKAPCSSGLSKSSCGLASLAPFEKTRSRNSFTDMS
mmetsp:Transcript_120158/g.374172  ORF Transcript_120158/g.374172 Transcript_120158/m.374172 type:complete len:210 (-) Transcript_120158:1885-2514(-)